MDCQEVFEFNTNKQNEFYTNLLFTRTWLDNSLQGEYKIFLLSFS